jgi:hypothetical protein
VKPPQPQRDAERTTLMRTMRPLGSVTAQLRRRRVWQVGAIYVVAAGRPNPPRRAAESPPILPIAMLRPSANRATRSPAGSSTKVSNMMTSSLRPEWNLLAIHTELLAETR